MDFCIDEWRKMYDKINQVGKLINDSTPRYDKFTKETIYQKINLTNEKKFKLRHEMEVLTKKVARYLSTTNMFPNPPLWHYDIHNERTWLSSSQFEYKHLVR
jgi:hypothetical protein